MHRRICVPAEPSSRRAFRWRCAMRASFLSALALAAILATTPADAGGTTFRDSDGHVSLASRMGG